MASIRKTLFALFLFFLFTSPTFAERVTINRGDASVDLPEGYIVVASNDKGFQLDWAIVPVSFFLRIYEKDSSPSPKEALEKALTSLNAQFEAEEVNWRNQMGAVSSFSMRLKATDMTGYGIATLLPETSELLVCLTWCPAKQAKNCNAFMVSVLDAVNIDAGSYFEGGIMTQYLYPASNWQEVSLAIDGKTIKTFLRENDAEASSYLIEREYEVLYNYVQSKQWLEAWQRYYRMIFRDSYARLLRTSFDIYNVLAPDCADDTDLAQKLLTWTQGFTYEREKTASDFASLPSVLLGGGSDCDSRSMLLSVLLTQMNQDAILLVSRQYSHALCAITSDHPGHSFTYNEKEYLMGDTTATGVSWGMIAAEQDNQSQWIPVFFP